MPVWNECDPVTHADQTLPRCARTPNCVCSEYADASRFIDPFVCPQNIASAWQSLLEVGLNFPGARLVERGPDRLCFECRTGVFRFVDDLMFRLDQESGLIHVRSASRLGFWDFGKNRRRVEEVRRRWERTF
ncbi:MAG: DUF1499 domain-containing protein [Planctomycetaceae bacterium]